MDCHSDNPFAIPDKCLTSAPAVIPAQAGIQWFIAYIPAQAGMTTWVIPASAARASRAGLEDNPRFLSYFHHIEARRNALPVADRGFF